MNKKKHIVNKINNNTEYESAQSQITELLEEYFS